MSFETNRKSAAQACEDGHSFEPVFPDTDIGIGATITVRGPRSQAARELARREYARAQASELSQRKAGKPESAPELDALDDVLTDMAVAYTMDWQGMEAVGQPLPYSEAAARTLYRQQPWLCGQVIREAQDLGNFIRP